MRDPGLRLLFLEGGTTCCDWPVGLERAHGAEWGHGQRGCGRSGAGESGARWKKGRWTLTRGVAVSATGERGDAWLRAGGVRWQVGLRVGR